MIWIDLTDISVWTGHHTGTQRVVYQLAQRYASQPDVGYFVFDRTDKAFYQADFDQIDTNMNAVHEVASDRTRRRLERLKVVGYQLYAESPHWLQSRLAQPRAKARLKRFYHAVRRGMAAPNSTHGHNGQRHEVEFHENDVVLVLGKAWDFAPDFMETMRQVKQRTHLRLVQLIYDLIPIFMPHLHDRAVIEPYTGHMFEVMSHSDGLLAISKSTKRDIERFCTECATAEPPIQVVRLGDDFSAAEAAKPEHPHLDQTDFIICVGTLEVRKNHQLLYTTYREAISRGLRLPKLVIVGGRGWYTGDVLYQLTHDPAMRDLVYVCHQMTDGNLRWLYENCLLTIYPSVYEGWGLPIAESLYYGKVCLASKASSMVEIAGDLLDYFSPYNSGECLELITRYLDPSIRLAKERLIRERYVPTSWDQTFAAVQQFLDVRPGVWGRSTEETGASGHTDQVNWSSAATRSK